MKNKSKLVAHRNRWGWLFISPFVVGILVFYLEILGDSLRFSFNKVVIGTTGYSLIPQGWSYYSYVLTKDPHFLPALLSALTQFLRTVPVIVLLSLFIATLLNQKMVGRSFFRTLFFVPVVLSTGIVAFADLGNAAMDQYQNMAGISSGLTTSSWLNINDLQTALIQLNIGTDVLNYVIEIVNNIFDVVNHSGIQIILFLAGLQSISPSIYEAASIEGATGWESFWKITLPIISPIVLVNTIYSTIVSFTDTTNPIMRLVSSDGGSSYDYSTCSAISWLYFIVICVVLGLIILVGGLMMNKKRTQ